MFDVKVRKDQTFEPEVFESMKLRLRRQNKAFRKKFEDK